MNEQEIEQNKVLVKKYPFLRLHNLFEYTWLDYMPEGWKQCFGELLCEDILKHLQKSLIKPEDFKITDIKEKYGTLRLYYFNEIEGLDEIIMKYEHLSAHTCIHCGKVNVPIYGGWICPYCDDCAKQIYPEPLKNSQIDNKPLENTFKVTTYVDGKDYEKVLDISDIIERIDMKFKGDFYEQ